MNKEKAQVARAQSFAMYDAQPTRELAGGDLGDQLIRALRWPIHNWQHGQIVLTTPNVRSPPGVTECARIPGLECPEGDSSRCGGRSGASRASSAGSGGVLGSGMRKVLVAIGALILGCLGLQLLAAVGCLAALDILTLATNRREGAGGRAATGSAGAARRSRACRRTREQRRLSAQSGRHL